MVADSWYIFSRFSLSGDSTSLLIHPGLVLCSEHMPSYTHMTDEHEERNVPVVYHDLTVLTII